MYDFIPGMASIMEDTDVDVSVEVSDDTAEDVSEDIEEQATVEEATEAESESEETEEAVEMTLRKYAELENALDHVKQYGVDRSFVSLMNYNDTLGRIIQVSFPAVESMDATGDPYSKLSQSTIAGLESVLATAWEWIKQLCEKILNAFKKAATWVVDLFQGYERKLKALEKQADDAEFAKDWASDVPESEKINKRDNNAVALAEKVTGDIKKSIDDTKQDLMRTVDKIDEDTKVSSSDLKDAGKQERLNNKSIDKFKSAYETAKSKLRETQPIKNLRDPLGEAKWFIQHGFKSWDKVKELRADLDAATKTVQQVRMDVAKLDSKKQTKGRSRAQKAIAKGLSVLQRIVSLKIQIHKDMCHWAISNASKILKYSEEKDND